MGERLSVFEGFVEIGVVFVFGFDHLNFGKSCFDQSEGDLTIGMADFSLEVAIVIDLLNGHCYVLTQKSLLSEGLGFFRDILLLSRCVHVVEIEFDLNAE